MSEQVVDPLAGTLLGELRDIVVDSTADYLKAKAGNKAAATRVRKKMMRVKELYKEVRTELSPKKK